MKPGDLVRLRETYTTSSRARDDDEFIVGNLDMSSAGFPVPHGSIGIVVKIVEREEHQDGNILHVMVPDGRIGWVYPEDCEAFNEDS